MRKQRKIKRVRILPSANASMVPQFTVRYHEGYAAGLAAARDAVAALLPADYEANWCAAIDAIDALRDQT